MLPFYNLAEKLVRFEQSARIVEPTREILQRKNDATCHSIAAVLVLGFVCLRCVPRLRASRAARLQAYRQSEPAYF